jgi:hypothetical protein
MQFRKLQQPWEIPLNELILSFFKQDISQLEEDPLTPATNSFASVAGIERATTKFLFLLTWPAHKFVSSSASVWMDGDMEKVSVHLRYICATHPCR